MFVCIGGKRIYLWRAVDAEGEVLDCLVQSRRNKQAALRLMRKLIRKYRTIPSIFVTDRLPSYAAARDALPLSIAHERGLRQNNRAESSHVPVRRRERKMQRFRSAGSAQRFLSAHASVYNTLNIRPISSRLQRSVGFAPKLSRHGVPPWASLPEGVIIGNQLN